jgi:prevent-host-death family protein
MAPHDRTTRTGARSRKKRGRTTQSAASPAASRAGQSVRGAELPSAAPAPELSMTATEAKNQFGRVMEAVERGPVRITRNHQVKAVVVSAARYEELLRHETSTSAPALTLLGGELETVYERMQGAKAKAGLDQALASSPEEFGETALASMRGARKQ